MELVKKYLNEANYTEKELSNINIRAATINVQVRDYDGNSTKWFGLNERCKFIINVDLIERIEEVE